MRAVFLSVDAVMQPLAGMLTSATTTEWLRRLGSAIASHLDVEVILYGDFSQTYPHALAVELLEALRNRVAAAISPSDGRGAIEAYLQRRPDIADFIILDEQSAVHDARLNAHLVVCDPSAGAHDTGAIDVAIWLDGAHRPRDMTAVPASEEGAEPHSNLNPARRAPAIERVIATVSFVIPEFELARLDAPGGLTVSVGKRTPGVDWRKLQPGQRVECDVQGEYATRVIRARLLSGDAAANPNVPLPPPQSDPEQKDSTE